MIENLIPKSILNIALILVTIIIGIILHISGRPYNNGVFAIHKLTTVALVFFFIKMLIIPLLNSYDINITLIVIIVLATLSVLGLIASGGAMSLDKSHQLMLTIHRISTVVFLLSISGFFYTVLQTKQA